MSRSLIAYYRVSTQQQGRSGLGLEAQQASCAAYANQGCLSVIAEYTEVESGRRCDRPQLAAATSHAKAARAALYVAKLDRLARDAAFLLSLIDGGVDVVFGDLPDLVSGDPITGRLILTVMAAIAEFEGRRIGQRIREATARRKARGDVMGWAATKAGRNPLTAEHRRSGCAAAAQANRQRAAAFRDTVLPKILEWRLQGMSLAAVAEALNAAGYQTRSGLPWTLANVHRLISSTAVI